jgi:NADH dehydrogenase [ubiquinone] 1 alpha subcomplex assembly factor 7
MPALLSPDPRRPHSLSIAAAPPSDAAAALTAATPSDDSSSGSSLSPGAVVEYSPAAAGLAAQVGVALARCGGAALVVDYGHGPAECSAATGRPSVRGIRAHAFTETFLEAPGEVDLSADVDFGALAEAAVTAAAAAAEQQQARRASAAEEGEGAEAEGAPQRQQPPPPPPRLVPVTAYGPLPQGAFLSALGLGARLERLRAAAPDAATRDRLTGEAARLADADQMGAIYKVLALVAAPPRPPNAGPLPPPPAFEGADVWEASGGSSA